MLHDLLILYTLFFRMGAVTFGGGYAMLPILRREIIQNRGWMDEETIMDYYALSQGLPGIIAINVSVFIGYKRRGVPGAVASALGMGRGEIIWRLEDGTLVGGTEPRADGTIAAW